VCRRLATSHSVAVGTHRRTTEAETLAAEIRERGSAAAVVAADVTTANGVAEAFAAAESLGPLQTVVHCVGGWSYPRLGELTDELIDAELALNLRSALLVLNAAANRVVDRGRVVLLSSASADVAPARQAVYAAAKAGVEVAARVAAKELARRGVTVNAVRPGATDTETLREGTSPRAIEAMAGANAFGRLGTPDDIAGVVVLLCSEEAAWITGAVVDATGGLR